MGRYESALVEVESSQVTLEINMQPLASRLSRFPYTDSEHLRCNPSVPISVGHHSVQNERVQRAIPCNIHKSHKIIRIFRADPSEAVTIYLRPPIVIEDTMLKPCGVQTVQRPITECVAPYVRDIHDGDLVRISNCTGPCTPHVLPTACPADGTPHIRARPAPLVSRAPVTE
jgi:hypothetical protein